MLASICLAVDKEDIGIVNVQHISALKYQFFNIIELTERIFHHFSIFFLTLKI